MRAAIPFAAAMLLAACTTTTTGADAPTTSLAGAEAPPPLDGWRAELRTDDVARIDRLAETWAAARDAALPRHRAAVAEAGELLRADAALQHPAIPPGSYDCRLTALGRDGARRATYTRFGGFFCYVRGEADGSLSFTKQTGTDLPGGWLRADGDRRYVFVGARQRRPGSAELGYGTDRARDLVGVVERVAPMRWRLVIPSRTAAAALEVYELTPVPSDRQGAEAAG